MDLHSHVGLLSAPYTSGAFEVNSIHGPVLPWLRSIDGFNTHDLAFELTLAGGVTSALVLPGSGNAIGACMFNMPVLLATECVDRWTGLHDEAEKDKGAVADVHDSRASAHLEWHCTRPRPALALEAHEVRRRFISHSVSNHANMLSTPGRHAAESTARAWMLPGRCAPRMHRLVRLAERKMHSAVQRKQAYGKVLGNIRKHHNGIF